MTYLHAVIQITGTFKGKRKEKKQDQRENRENGILKKNPKK